MIDNQSKTVIKFVMPGRDEISHSLAAKVMDTSVCIEGTRIASLPGLIALKLVSALADRHGGLRQ